jgi:heme-degrading monooxygenase HmoA
MSSAFVSSNWLVKDGAQTSFVESWTDFLEWTSHTVSGLRWAMLLRDGDDSRHFISMAEWETPAQRDAWRNHPGFAAHLGPCRTLCDEFRGADYALVASVGADRLPSM